MKNYYIHNMTIEVLVSADDPDASRNPDDVDEIKVNISSTSETKYDFGYVAKWRVSLKERWEKEGFPTKSQVATIVYKDPYIGTNMFFFNNDRRLALDFSEGDYNANRPWIGGSSSKYDDHFPSVIFMADDRNGLGVLNTKTPVEPRVITVTVPPIGYEDQFYHYDSTNKTYPYLNDPYLKETIDTGFIYTIHLLELYPKPGRPQGHWRLRFEIRTEE